MPTSMMKGAFAKKSKGFSWQSYLLWGSILWVTLNFYLAEKLSHLTDSPPPEADGFNNKDTKHVNSQKSSSFDRKSYSFNRKLAEDALASHGRDTIFQPLRAYVEKKLNDTVPGTLDKGNLDEKKPKVEVGKPGKFYVPLPLREGSPEDVSQYRQHTIQMIFVLSFIVVFIIITASYILLCNLLSETAPNV